MTSYGSPKCSERGVGRDARRFGKTSGSSRSSTSSPSFPSEVRACRHHLRDTFTLVLSYFHHVLGQAAGWSPDCSRCIRGWRRSIPLPRSLEIDRRIAQSAHLHAVHACRQAACIFDQRYIHITERQWCAGFAECKRGGKAQRLEHPDQAAAIADCSCLHTATAYYRWQERRERASEHKTSDTARDWW